MALAVLLLGAGVLYVWGLGASGWANSFCSAAVQAGSQSWKAFFFGASDAANAITVDKTPASLWPMALSVRIFGQNSWAVLVPQALMGVGAVAVVYATVRRSFPARAALLAGTAMAVTPVAVLMFRFDNPDALLVLSLTVAGYCVTRARERGSTRWLLGAGAVIGFAFLVKMLQAFLVVPGFALVHLVTAPGVLWRRVWQLLAAGAAMVAAAGWWLLPAALALLVAVTWLTRRASRTDPVRAAVWVWESWLVVTGLVFSLMQGIFHAYYTVALAPAVAVLVGTGGTRGADRTAAGRRADAAGPGACSTRARRRPS
ncbi:glycosyltransferase family 39 protein [Nonomuraea sp. NPDC049607]|uniref:glycosyltransferase family 39 protein n=1 Tax=Nonomuraea sp. NPDC049607 TaxID=3154732 RepID=UPI0034245365